ncbi:MAG: TonB-dependent receptor [Acidobacteria bacterium]|nr:TonB-dependent receptor [Acidobacteriota bacterium]
MRANPWTRRVALLAFLLHLAGIAAVQAQVTTGTIVGSVIDPSGRPIAGATMVASDGLRAVNRTTVSDGTGRYRFADLAPALYDISAVAPGFERVQREQVTVAVDSQQRLDFYLPVAGVVQAVEVTAPLASVQIESADLGTIIDQRRIESLPLNRRDFLQLAMLTPGVNPAAQGSELSSRGSFAMHANGGREEYNNFLLDGVDNNDPYVNRYVVQPPVDSIQEFKIATNSYSAEYGRSAAGQVNVITKSGSNRFELAIYEYFRNQVLNARDAFDEPGVKPPFNRNQFGASLGGPLLRNRTFAFASLDLLRERRSVTRLSTVPTDLQRSGNLSELPSAVIDPFTQQPFDGNILPVNRIDPIALKVLDLFPHANRPGLAGNYLYDAPLRESQNQAAVRIDHRLSDSAQLTVRYNHGLVDAIDPYGEDTETVPGFGNSYRDPAHNAMMQYQRVLGGRAISTTLGGFNSYARDILPENRGTDVGKLWGVDWLQVSGRDFGYPSMTVAGFSKIGDSTNLPIQRKTTTYQFAQAVTLDRGQHLWRFGGEIRHQRLDGNLDILARGSLSFSGFISGSGISDLLLGYPSFGLQSKSDNTLRLRTTAYNIYAQDDWKVGPNITINLGVRYEYNTPAVDPTNHMSSFDAATGTVVPVGTQGMPAAGMQPDRNNIAPRVGLAWRPRPGLAVRAGYGLYYDASMFEVNSAQYFNPPQFTLRVFFPTQFSLLTLADPFPSNGGFAPPASLSTLSPDLVTSSMQHWNLSLQQQVGPVGTLTVSYAGSKGTSLIRPRDLNQPRPGPGDVQDRRPYPEYGSIFFVESAGHSTFNSLQLTLNHPLVRGVSVSAIYTLSKSMDDGSSFLGTSGDPNFPQDSQNVAAQWGPSNFDIRHRFGASFIYQLPAGNALTRDTELRGIVTVQSGQPLTPLLRFDNSNTGNTGQQSGADHPDLVGSPSISSPSAAAWFNTAAFAVPAPYTFGDAGRNILRGPGYSSVDLALARRIRLGANRRVWIEAQVFNLFNRVNYDQPEHYVDEAATFGRIFSAKAPRQAQLVVRVDF